MGIGLFDGLVFPWQIWPRKTLFAAPFLLGGGVTFLLEKCLKFSHAVFAGSIGPMVSQYFPAPPLGPIGNQLLLCTFSTLFNPFLK